VSAAVRATRSPKYRFPVRHHEDVLPNGLRVLAVPRPNANRAVLTMLFRVGSRYESADDNGISHFLEHMLYRGSTSLKTAHQQALAFEGLGGSLYAATQADYGTMNLTLPPDSLTDATALFAEVVREPRFSSIEIERGIVREEILEDLDSVEAVLGNLQFHLCSCIWALPESTLSQLARAENDRPRIGLRGMVR